MALTEYSWSNNGGNDASSLVVAISSRALFDLDDSHRIFEKQGLDAYTSYQVERENEILEPGIAFPLVQKLLALNDSTADSPRVEVILLSRNSGDTGLRIFNSIQYYGLSITRAAFTNGASPFTYIPAFGADLFLSAHADDVERALRAGHAAARILPAKATFNQSQELRIAFDGDAVLFSDEAERIYQQHGLDAFSRSEADAAERPLMGGPFIGILSALHRIQASYPAERSPIRTALVTSRGAPAHKRVILTLRHWGIRIDQALFLGGKDKAPFLESFGADIFFDDQAKHCEAASAHVATGHVPHGVTNE